MNFKDNNVTFRDIYQTALKTGGLKLSGGQYKTDAHGDITSGKSVINAIDIDWCKALVPGIDDPITSTGQLLAIIGQLKQAIAGSEASDHQSLLERVNSIEEIINGLGESVNSIDELVNNIGNEYATKNFVNEKIQDLIGAAPEALNTLEELAQAIEEGGGAVALIQNLQDRIDAVNNRIDEYHTEYNITYNLINVSGNSNNVTSMKKNDIITLGFTANTGYILPDAATVEGAEFNYSNGTMTLANPSSTNIIVTLTTNNKRQCNWTIPSLSNLSCTLDGNINTFTINDTFGVTITVTGDPELYGLPTSITASGCTVVSYNANTGSAILRCNGTGNMTISANAKDVATYRFAVALEENTIFTKSNGNVTGANLTAISALEGAMSAVGQCPVDFANGFTAPSSVNVEGKFVWFIIPSKFFNTSNFNFINGNNKYLLKQSNIQDLTVDTKLKECVVVNGGKIQYTLICVSNNGLGGKQEFKKI